MKNRLLLLFPIAFALIVQACSSGSDTVIIAGQVIEAGSGNAISDAIVEVTDPANLQQTATTDSAGNFSFDVDPGSEAQMVTLEISKQSYETTTTSFKIAPETNVDDLIIELQSTSNSDSGGGDSGDDEEDTVGGEAGEPNSLELMSITNSAIAIRGTGGDEQSTFTFAVRDSAGRSVSQGYEVNFSIITGPDGGEFINPTTGYTNSEGRVKASIASGDSAGVVKIEASLDQPSRTIRSTPVLVAIGNGFTVSENFRIAPVNTNIEAWGIIGSSKTADITNIIVASLGDYRNNPVLPGTAVDFTTTAGIIQANSVTDDRGLAIAWLRPDGSKPTGHSRGIGFATVTARTIDVNDNYVTDQTDLLFTSRDPDIVLSPTAVNGPTTFSMTITDVNGYPIAAGSTIQVNSSQGTTNNFGTKTLGDYTAPGPGRTEFGFTVSDANPDDPFPAEASVTVTVTLPSGISKTISSD